MSRKINTKDSIIAMGLSIAAAGGSGGLVMGAIESVNQGNEVKGGIQGAAGVAALLWASSLYLDRRPRKPALAQIVASMGEPVKVNGKNMFLNAVPWIGKKQKQQAHKRVTPAFYVPYRDQVNPVRIPVHKVGEYARFGWLRQQASDPAPFSRSKFRDAGWTPQLESCCYKVLGFSGCFDTFGGGAKSKLVIPPHRVPGVCLLRFAPTLEYHLANPDVLGIL